MPDNNTPIYIVDKDKELQQPVIDMMFKHDVLPDFVRGTVVEMSNDVLRYMALSMLNARLNEKGQDPNCPYISAFCGDEQYLISKPRTPSWPNSTPRPVRTPLP